MLKISHLTDYAVVSLSQMVEKLPDEITSAKNPRKTKRCQNIAARKNSGPMSIYPQI